MYRISDQSTLSINISVLASLSNLLARNLFEWQTRLGQIPFCCTSTLRCPSRTSTIRKMAPSVEEKSRAIDAGHDSGNVEGKDNEWKFRAPYKIHEEADFKAMYEGSCHCGRVKYQLSREEPLAAKYCHCTT